MAKSNENIINWHPEAKAIQDKLELNLLQIMQYHTKGNDKINRELLYQIRKAIAGAIWEEGNRASKESNQAWAKGDHETANEISLRVMGLNRAQDIASGDYR